MRTFKVNVDEPIMLEVYRKGFQYVKMEVIIKQIEAKPLKPARFIFEQVIPQIKPDL